MYREEILNLYRKPLNEGTIEESEKASGENPSCGDSIELYVKVKDGKIADIKHQTDACAIATASISIISDQVVGMSVNEVLELEKDWLLDQVDIDLSPMRLNCALLGLKTMKSALKETD